MSNDEKPPIFEAEDGSLRMRGDLFVRWALLNGWAWGDDND